MNYDINNFPLDLVLNILSIVILFVLLRLLVYKPVKKYLDARRRKIDDAFSASEEKAADAERVKGEYEAKLKNADETAKADAEAIIADAKKRADEIVREAEERAEKVLSLAEEKILAERAEAKKKAEMETVTLAIDIAEKILERRVNDSDTINMAQRFFEGCDNK